MIYPSKIEPGDTIGIVAPAGKLEQNVVIQAANRIEKMGYKVKLGKFLHEYRYNFSSSDENRLYDLQDMLDDESVKAIVCTRGGYGMIRRAKKELREGGWIGDEENLRAGKGNIGRQPV